MHKFETSNVLLWYAPSHFHVSPFFSYSSYSEVVVILVILARHTLFFSRLYCNYLLFADSLFVDVSLDLLALQCISNCLHIWQAIHVSLMICFWKPKTLYTYGAFGCTTKIMICCSLLCFLKIQFFKYLGITFTDQASMYNLNYQNLKVLNEDMIMILNLKMSKHRLYFLLFN